MNKNWLFLIGIFVGVLLLLPRQINYQSLPDEQFAEFRSTPRLNCDVCANQQRPVAFRPTTSPSSSFEHLYQVLPTQISSYVSPAGHFRLWFVTQTVDAVPTKDANSTGRSDWVETAADAFDDAWFQQIDQMGFIAPPNDSAYAPAGTPALNVGLDGLFDVYFLDLSANLISGFTQSEWQAPPNSARSGGSSSYIVIENDFAGKDDAEREVYLRITAAHEFHHAVQYGYSLDMPRWWMEATAVFAEDKAMPQVNSYVPYTNLFLESPQLPLWKRGGSREYGATVWPQFLANYYSQGRADILRSIYAYTASHPGSANFFNSIDAVLRSETGDSMDKAFSQFTVWNYFTGSRDDKRHYADGAAFREVSLTGLLNYPPNITRNADPAVLPQGLGCNYLQFENLSFIKAGNFRIRFDGQGDGAYRWRVALIVFTNTGFSYTTEISLNSATNDGGIIFENPYLLDRIIMIPAVVSYSSAGLSYTYSAEIVPATIATEEPDPTQFAPITDVSAFPNPFREQIQFAINLNGNLPSDPALTLSIYNAAGQKVRDLLNDQPASGAIFWDGRDNNGRRLNAGVYLYRLTAGRQVLQGKITLL